MPFKSKPELLDNDYISVPTVTRQYIDTPSDNILDSIVLNHHKKPLPIIPTSTHKSKKPTQLTIDTTRTHEQSYNYPNDQITNWLSNL